MTKADDEIIDEAKVRFKLCSDYESYARENFKFDRRFDAQDSVNNYGWPDDRYAARIKANRPCLTVNKVHQHILNVTNDAKVNRPALKYAPVSGGATFKASEVLNGIQRHIFYVSNADDAFDTAMRDQVVGGIGYWRVTTDYASPTSFDQEIRIKRIPDALSVYLDIDIMEVDGSDANYGFIFSDMPRDEFERKYPKFKDKVDQSSPLGAGAMDDDLTWAHSDDEDKHVRILEYYRKTENKDTLHLMSDGSKLLESEAKENGVPDGLMSLRSRDVSRQEVEWYLIASDQIIARNIFPSKYIPIVRIIGEENVVDGQYDRHGLIRPMIDSQRMYNVESSAAVEYVGGQTKTQWIGPVAAFESYTEVWSRANTETVPYLPYNDWDDVGNRQVDAPQRIEPPQAAPAYTTALAQAAGDMDMVSGQHEATFGQASQERSGAAINARVTMASNATAHYVYNLGIGLRYTGKIILDLIPKVYDTKRTLRILAQDGSQSTIEIDPDLKTAHQDVLGSDDEHFSPDQISAILNPSVGEFDVVADVSSRSFATQRMETFQAIAGILQQNESLTPIIGKFLFKAADFPLADEIANALDEHFSGQADPALTAAQQHLAAQHAVMLNQQNEIEKLKSSMLIKEQQKEIDEYKAQTDRMKVVGDIDPQGMIPILREMISQVIGQAINPLIHAHAIENQVLQMTLNDMQPEGDQSAQGGSPPILPEPTAQ